MKKYKFLDKTEVEVDDMVCRGCYLEKAKNLPSELEPIWENDFFIIRQDAECPVPGFYILSTKQHIHTIGDLDEKNASRLGIILNRLRYAMMESAGIHRVHVILEERMIEPHLHIWMLPLWTDVMEKFNIDPKVWNSNIYEYISLFSYDENRETIISINNKMRAELRRDPVLCQII